MTIGQFVRYFASASAEPLPGFVLALYRDDANRCDLIAFGPGDADAGAFVVARNVPRCGFGSSAEDPCWEPV